MKEQDITRRADKKDWTAFLHLLKKARIPWLLIGVACALSVASSKLSVLFPDYSIQFFEMGDITRKTVSVGIAILLGAAVVSIVRNYIEAWLRTTISMRLRDRVLDKILAFRIGNLHRMHSRELISRTANDTSLLSDFLVTVFLVVAGELFYFYFSMEMIFSYNTTLFLFQLLFVPLSLFIHVLQGKYAYRYQYRIQLRLSRLTEYLSELLVNVPLIKIFTTEKRETVNGEERIDKYAAMRTKLALIDVIFMILDELARFGNRIFAIVYGGYLVHQGTLDIGTWIAYYMLVEQTCMNVELITAQWSVLKSVQGAVSRTAEIMTMEEEVYEGLPIEDGDAKAFAFKDLKLRLGDRAVLKGIDTCLPRQKKIAIVGSSGSGKSSLLNVLIRFYDGEDGGLYQGEQDVRTLDLASYRRQFAYVFQDVKLFSETLRYNLSYGVDRPVSDEEIIACCRKAALEGFLAKQEKGLDSHISEGGSNVSGGEMQRIGIVRALLRNPDLILLDEATANLDAETEERVLEMIHKESLDKTLIMVAHRMGVVSDADLILFVQDGKVLGSGTHETLLKECGAYRALVEAEAGGDRALMPETDTAAVADTTTVDADADGEAALTEETDTAAAEPEADTTTDTEADTTTADAGTDTETES